ncbi:No extended memory [Aphelenchoides bicaudatus]|nr:No extended memory [Aphelenchoides bicaudatus]
MTSHTCTIIDQFSPLLDEMRKTSLTDRIHHTTQGLNDSFANHTPSPEDLIFNMFKIPNKNEASIGKLIMVLKNYGLQENDPRLLPMMKHIWEIEKAKEERTCEARDPKHWKLKRDDFEKCISESLCLISQTLQNDLVIPSWTSFTRSIKQIFDTCRSIEEGKVADYIPQLKRVDPNLWGVSVCSIDGQRCSYGDTKVPFCVQSVSKAFNYAIACSDLTSEYVHQFIGQEPSGRLYNEICLDGNKKPHSPLINSGAIITSSLLQNKMILADRFDYMIQQYRKISGGEYVGFNNAVFLSERSTADRNMALAYFMQENKCFPEETKDLMEALDFYFMLCSLETTCESLSVMAATLANGGVCPITGERVISSPAIRDLLSLMSSCGMYDGSGQFAFHVGLPAKSGVSGVMMVVVPNVTGIALFSPRLNKQGNSTRGLAFCHQLIQRFNFHTYDSLLNNESRKIDPRKHSNDRLKEQVVSLLFAAKAGDLNAIRRLYMHGYDLEIADYDKRTALHLAAFRRPRRPKVRPDPKDRWQRTPVMDAQAEKHIECIRLLEKAMTVHEKSEDEEDCDRDSGVILPAFRKSPSKTKSLISQSIPSSESESSDSEEEEVFELDENRNLSNENIVQTAQSDSAYLVKKPTRQTSDQPYKKRSYSATQIDVFPRRFML